MSEEPGSGAPLPFLWGVATSAYQTEGGYNGPGQPQTNWAHAERAGRVALTGRSADFWKRYPEDFATCGTLGLSAFRLGVEWSRIQPTLQDAEGPPPDFDYAALDHYAEMLAACRRSGMEPVLSLQHFVHPAWLGDDVWLKPETVEHFERYVSTSVRYLNLKLLNLHQAPVRLYLTVNEPNMLALNTHLGSQFPGAESFGLKAVSRCLSQLLRAHVRAYRAIHAFYREQGWDRPWVSCNLYCSDIYWLDKLLLDLLAARERGIAPSMAQRYVLDRCRAFEAALAEAGLPYDKDLAFRLGSVLRLAVQQAGRFAFRAGDFDPFWETLFEGPDPCALDYVAVDYYDPFAAHMFRTPSLLDHEAPDPGRLSRLWGSLTSKWWDWRSVTGGLGFFCSLYATEYARPVLIAENGMALHRRTDNAAIPRRDKLTRSAFLQRHLAEVAELRRRGVPLLGYLHWSLFDNYEWGTFTPRFGLFSLDYGRGTARLRQDHQGDCPSVTYRRLIRSVDEWLPEAWRVSD